MGNDDSFGDSFGENFFSFILRWHKDTIREDGSNTDSNNEEYCVSGIGLFLHIYNAWVMNPGRVGSKLGKQGIRGPPPSLLSLEMFLKLGRPPSLLSLEMFLKLGRRRCKTTQQLPTTTVNGIATGWDGDESLFKIIHIIVLFKKIKQDGGRLQPV